MKHQALRDSHFRPDHAGDGITQWDKDDYLARSAAIVAGVAQESAAGGSQTVVKKTKWHRTASQDWIMGNLVPWSR